MTGEKIINFKLDAETFEKLTKQKSLHVEYKKTGVLELVSNDARIRLDTIKGSTSPKADATYYNNNSSTLHFMGDTILATPTIKKTEEKKSDKESVEQRDKVARRIELLDIPSTTDNSSPSPSNKAAKISTSSLKKSSPSKKPKSTSKSNIPTPTTPSSTSRSSNTPQKTSKSSKLFDPLVSKATSPSEEKYSMKSRILQRLAIQPWSLIEITKSLNRSQLERCEQLEVKHILDMVAIPIKKDGRKKFCLKPNLYKDIQIWTWPFYSNTDKKKAADNAKEAYDLLQSQGFDIDRSNLYHPDSPYKPPVITSPMLANGKKTLSPLNHRKPVAQQEEKGKGRSTPVDHASPSTPLLPSKLASPQKNKPITPTQQSSEPAPLPQATTSTTPAHLKPSSLANKRYASKALPQQQNSGTTTAPEKLTPVLKKKSAMNDDDVPSRDTLVMPMSRSKKRVKEPAAGIVSTPKSTTKVSTATTPSASVSSPASTTSQTTTTAAAQLPPHQPRPKEPTSIKPLSIKSQGNFNAYCYSYVKQQKDYIRIKGFFKSNFPQYIKMLQTTEPPKGTKRSYYDLNAEYQDMLKTNYLKQGDDDEQDFREAQDFLVDCNNKRRRLNYMWTSIKQNLDEYHYAIPKSLHK